MKKLVFLLFILSCGYYGLFAQTKGKVVEILDTAYAKYLPLSVGNIYVYLYVSTPIPVETYKVQSKITKDTVIEGKKYFYFVNSPLFQNNWIRYDSIYGTAIARTTNAGCYPYQFDKIVDSLAARVNDQSVGCFFSFYHLRRCLDTINITLFGTYPTKRKYFIHDGLFYGGASYARNFGVINVNYFEVASGSNYTLFGCVLNGVVYGDTTLTGINPISSEVHNKFSLLQNYPNPFNPVTKIKFDIPSNLSFQHVLSWNPVISLRIFDITGREIQTLVKEQLQPGTYEVTFYGGNLPSGIYFYQLRVEDPTKRTGEYTETKKLVLLK